MLPLENNTEWIDELANRIGNNDININFSGNLAQLIRMLNPEIKRENNRIGKNLIGGVT